MWKKAISNYSPNIGNAVVIKENTPLETKKIIELVTSRDQCTRSAKVYFTFILAYYCAPTESLVSNRSLQRKR